MTDAEFEAHLEAYVLRDDPTQVIEWEQIRATLAIALAIMRLVKVIDAKEVNKPRTW